MKNQQAKRVDIVSIQMFKEGSILYKDRKISSPENVVTITQDFIGNIDREKFIVIYLNTKNIPNAIHTVSVGNLNSAIIHPREVMKGAILSNSNAMILVHNHPSGDPTPSNEDILVTERLKQAGELLGIKVIDHVIIGEYGKFYSFKEQSLI